ncbi:hypothetical protein C8R47DRAFT_1119511 [Mycena vitilis]|nr:hypothetical protein C8R47DRAFT_1119511 [Mycena vitilis]
MSALTLYPHTPTMRPLWLMLASVLFAAAVPTNHTVDDADAEWIIGQAGSSNSSSVLCYACTNASAYGLDPTRLNNGTFTQLPWDTVNPVGLSPMTMQLTFNGTAIYVFVPVQAANDAVLHGMGPMFFALDGVDQAANYTPPAQLPLDPGYDVSAFATTALREGEHTFILWAPYGGMLDYVVYTSNDPDTVSGSSSDSQSGSTAPTVSLSAQSSPTRGAPQIPSGATGSKKPRTPAIVGGIVAGIAAIFLCLVGLLLVSRARRNKRRETINPSATEQSVISKEPVQVEAKAPFVAEVLWRQSTTPPLERDGHGLSQQVRVLTDEVQRLRQRVDGSSTTASGSDSLSRSISTMKREQTQAIHQHGLGTHVTDSLVRTDSGIRLSAGRAEDDLPPTYGAE